MLFIYISIMLHTHYCLGTMDTAENKVCEIPVPKELPRGAGVCRGLRLQSLELGDLGLRVVVSLVHTFQCD